MSIPAPASSHSGGGSPPDPGGISSALEREVALGKAQDAFRRLQPSCRFQRTGHPDVFCSALPQHWRSNKALPTPFVIIVLFPVPDGTKVTVAAGNDENFCADVKNNVAEMHAQYARFSDLRFVGKSGRGKFFNLSITLHTAPRVNVITVANVIKVTVDGPRESRTAAKYFSGAFPGGGFSRRSGGVNRLSVPPRLMMPPLGPMLFPGATGVVGSAGNRLQQRCSGRRLSDLFSPETLAAAAANASSSGGGGVNEQLPKFSQMPGGNGGILAPFFPGIPPLPGFFPPRFLQPPPPPVSINCRPSGSSTVTTPLQFLAPQLLNSQHQVPPQPSLNSVLASTALFRAGGAHQPMPTAAPALMNSTTSSAPVTATTVTQQQQHIFAAAMASLMSSAAAAGKALPLLQQQQQQQSQQSQQSSTGCGGGGMGAGLAGIEALLRRSISSKLVANPPHSTATSHNQQKLIHQEGDSSIDGDENADKNVSEHPKTSSSSYSLKREKEDDDDDRMVVDVIVEPSSTEALTEPSLLQQDAEPEPAENEQQQFIVVDDGEGEENSQQQKQRASTDSLASRASTGSQQENRCLSADLLLGLLLEAKETDNKNENKNGAVKIAETNVHHQISTNSIPFGLSRKRKRLDSMVGEIETEQNNTKQQKRLKSEEEEKGNPTGGGIWRPFFA